MLPLMLSSVLSLIHLMQCFVVHLICWLGCVTYPNMLLSFCFVMSLFRYIVEQKASNFGVVADLEKLLRLNDNTFRGSRSYCLLGLLRHVSGHQIRLADP
ncbi:unnamed protein product [Musa textilis]